MATNNNVYILPFFRRGLANYANEKDSLIGGSGEMGGSDVLAQISVSLKLNTGKGCNGEGPSRNFFIAGPEQVKGIDTKAICQVVPADGSVGAAYSNLAYVEFYEEDIPWRYTSLKKNDGKLRPWMVLLACKEGEYKLITNSDGTQTVELLPKDETTYQQLFPRLGTQHRYAHVQVTANISNDIVTFLEEHPEAGVSRILCHRAFDVSTQYHLFLVPAFETGRLGVLAPQELLDGGAHCSVDTASWAQSLEEAKRRAKALKYPVYHHWTFTTGETDFLGYAKRINPLLGKECYDRMNATLKLDINNTGLYAGLGKDMDPIDMPVALTMLNSKGKQMKSEEGYMTEELKKLLVKSPVLLENNMKGIDMEEDPWVVPPIYGARHTLAQPEVPLTNKQAVNDINLNFKHRAAAGLGAQVVKDYQGEFVVRAWGMVEQINKLNQRIREIYQMSKMNDASARKIDELRTFNLTDNLSGIQTNAAVKLINKVNNGAMSANSIAGNLAKADMSPMSGVLEPYNVGQGLTETDAISLTKANIWEGYELKIINSIPIMRMIRSIHKSDLNSYKMPKHNNFFDFYPEFNALRGVFAIRTPGYIIDFPKEKFFTPYWKLDKNEKKGIKVDALFFYGLEPRKTPKPRNYTTNVDYQEIYTWIRGIGDRMKIRKKTYLVDTIENEICATLSVQNSYSNPLSQSGYETSGFLYDLSMNYNLVTSISEGISEYGVMLPDHIYQSVFPSKQRNLVNGFKVAYYTPNRNLHYFVVAPYSAVMRTSPTFVLKEAKYSIGLGTSTLSGEWKFEYDNERHTFKLLDESTRLGLITGEKRFAVLGKAIDALEYLGDEPLTIKKGAKGNYKKGAYPFKLLVDSKYYTLSMEIENDTLYFQPYGRDENSWLGEAYKAAIIGKKKLEIYPNRLRLLLQKLRENIITVEDNSFIPDTIEWKSQYDLPTITAFDLAGGKKELDKIPVFHKAFKEMLRTANSKIANELKFKEQKPIPNPQQPEEEKKLVDATDVNLNKLRTILEHYREKGVSIDIINAYFNKRITNQYPVMAYPEFPDPTSFYLRERSDKFFLPSSGEIAKNSICCFLSNMAFEEAFLAGMNTEMARELLWREYPTDERGSYFRKFWDQPQLPESFDDNYYDVKRLNEWTNSLGRNHIVGKGQMLVFAIRADLMQVYPQIDIFMVSSSYDTIDRNTPRTMPDMCLWLTDEVYLVGFQGITKEAANNNMLVFAEKVSSQRFAFSRKPNGNEENSNTFAISHSLDKQAWGIPINVLS